MQKFIKFVTTLSFAFCTAVFAIVAVTETKVPDEIPVVNMSTYTENKFLTAETDDLGNITIKLLKIPIKTASASQVSRKYVVVSGTAFGIRLYSDGIVIVGSSPVLTENGKINPAENAGLKIGDVIKAIDGRRVTKNSDLSHAIKNCDGREIELLIESDDKSKVIRFTPVLSAEDNKYKAGLWIRDSTAGIGTITYFDPDTLTFAGLGHGICDVDTGEIMPLFGGDAVYAEIADVYKGSKSETGELCGIFTDEVMGPLTRNTSCGVFGSVTNNEIRGTTMPVAMKYEVKTGKAEIISTTDGTTPKKFDVEITRLYLNDEGTKGMAITVTDPELLKETGGIIQGMSGSPIIQSGMLVGAVTHVLVNDPTKGYGIFAQTMLEAAR